MSLLGKILAVLNALAALAFLYFALVDYGKRQVWTHAILRHDLRLKGLPLTPGDRDREGNLLVRELDPTTLNELLGGTGGPVTSQAAELQRVRQHWQAKIDDANPIPISNPLDPVQKLDLQTKVQKLAWCLRPLATTASRREGLDRLMTAGADDRLDNLLGVFDPKFEDELQKLDPAKRRQEIEKRLDEEWRKPFDDLARKLAALEKQEQNPGGPDKQDPAELRRAIANLLFGMAELAVDEATAPGKDRDLIGNPAYKRALAVVGLEAAVREMDDQAREFDKMTQAIRSGMARDREQFARRHASLLLTLLDAADDLQGRRSNLQREKEKADAQQTVLNVRKKEFADLTAKLEERQKATEALLKRQAEMEQKLFKAQQEFRDAAGQNHQLEQEIRTLEKGR